MISSSQISVVMQGPIIGGKNDNPENQLTRRCIESIRKFLPEAELILSTWTGMDVTEISHDILIQSGDPGTVKSYCEKNINLNRQMVSTQAGLRMATRPYIFKMRTDTVLTGNAFLCMFEAFPARAAKHQIFTHRVMIWNIFTKTPIRSGIGCYHTSDIVSFGRGEDIRMLWNVPLYLRTEEDLKEDERKMNQADVNETPISYLVAEQYIWLQCINKKEPAFLPKRVTACDAALSEIYLANNFIVLDTTQYEIEWKNAVMINRAQWAEIYNHAEWQQIYKKYCDPKFRVPFSAELAKKQLFHLILTRATFLRCIYSWFYHKIVPDGHGRAPEPLGKAVVKKLKSWLTLGAPKSP
ncbi:MAG: WavE lipopolysaccharide synthesis family protein [Chthoniobacteraceae bacterium]